MVKKLHAFVWKFAGIVSLFLLLAVTSTPLKAQQSPQDEQLKSLRSDVGIVGLAANLRWYNYQPSGFVMEESSRTELDFEFRNIRMLSPHTGIGFKVFTNVFMDGFFDEAGFGGFGIGPMLRYYPLESNRWQPYLQANGLWGYNLALGDAFNGEGVKMRSGLQGGIAYRVTNAFGIFLEAGPIWEYDAAFNLETSALKVNIGIQLYRFN